jgi:Collagen triple helix repeat (20 copies)
MKPSIAAAALALAAILPAMPANAQSIRTFVSAAGSDSNPCSITEPCRHFQAAVNVTSPEGEVDALDPGAYGSFTINQAVTIEGQGWAYVAPAAGGAAITVNAVSGNIIIHGVSFNGAGEAGTVGIQFNSGGSLNVQDSLIRNFGSAGIAFTPSGSSTLFVSNTIISHLVSASGTGINIAPGNGGTVSAVLNRVDIQDVGGTGVNAAGSNTTATLKASTIVNNTVGVNMASGAAVISYGNNAITGNTTNVVGGSIPELGAVGPAGPTGPTGPAGAVGAAGATGATGPTGAVGPAGATGAVGAAGATGAIGPAGPTGATGATGPQGTVLSFAQYSDRSQDVASGAALVFSSTDQQTGSDFSLSSDGTTVTFATAGVYLVTFYTVSPTNDAGVILFQNGQILVNSDAEGVANVSNLAGSTMVAANVGDEIQAISESVGTINMSFAHLIILRLR